MSGRLVLCATPIGNLEDLSERAARTLREADLIACEDTRRTRKLLTHLGIKPRRLVAYHEGNERAKAGELLNVMVAGGSVVLVSDAGMPGMSDPGYRVVRACVDAGIEVTVIPGANAAISALVISGLPSARFAFEGFLPRKRSERKRHISELVEEPRTLVLYESPHRIEASLADLLDVLGDRPAALARELTKIHEEVRRGSLSELLAGVVATPPKGEIVLVVQGATGEHRPAPEPHELAARAKALMEDGVPRAEAMSRVSKEAGVARRDVFNALLDEPP